MNLDLKKLDALPLEERLKVLRENKESFIETKKASLKIADPINTKSIKDANAS